MNATGQAGAWRVWTKLLAWSGVGLFLIGAMLVPAHASVTVNLTAPSDGTVYVTPPANITLSATASAGQGYTLSKVEFFHGGTNLIASDTTAPYGFDWTNVPPGTYAITAVATAVKKNSPNQTATSATATVIVNAAPSVTLTSPAPNAVFGTGGGGPPATIVLTANATDTDGTISQVQFYDGTTWLASDTSAPFDFVWGNVPLGSHSLTAVAIDNRGAETFSTAVPVTVTQRPTAFFAGPQIFPILPSPGNVILNAVAFDPDGSVSKVEFFNGAQLLTSDTIAPYSFNWQSIPAGSYSPQVVATDNLGVTSIFSPPPFQFIVTDNPKTTLTSPTAGATYSAPASITLTADAISWFPGGSIQQVEFFHGGTNLIATLTSPPYTFDWQNVPIGNYTLTVVATESLFPWKQYSVGVNITVNQSSALYFIHTDHLNTPRLISNMTGQTVWTWANDDPFGANVPNENPSGAGNFVCNLRLPGQYFDKETNLHYNYFRDYDPGIGRYVEADPLGITMMGEPIPTNHLYNYVENNPLSYFDPWGLCRVEVRFKPAPGAGRMGIYHTYIITTAPNGSQTYFRGGPTGRPTPAQPIWGNITTIYGAYGPNTPDWDPGNPPSVVLLDNNEPCDCYDASFTATLITIKAANISYIPLRRNSNSVVGTALTNAGFGSFKPPVTAPALWNNLNRWKPQ